LAFVKSGVMFGGSLGDPHRAVVLVPVLFLSSLSPL
jgi:hypothetical protein